MEKRKLQTLLVGAMTLQAACAVAQEPQADYSAISSGVATAISPSGKYAVGVAAIWDNTKFSSFLWNTQTKQDVATTVYDDADFSKGGMFNYVNDNGIVAGAMRSNELKLDVPGSDWSDPYTVYFVSAALWKDGQRTDLGVGDQTLNDFNDEFDGSYAVSVSADGNTVAGYIYKTYMKSIACGWTYNAATGKYDYYRYATPTANALSSVNGMSADGKIAVGYVQYNGVKRPAVWTSPSSCKELDLGTDITLSYGGEAASVSPNGKYALVYVNGNDEPRIGVYDLEQNTLNKVQLTDAYNVTGLTVDNFGNFFCTVTDNDYDTKTYYYSAENNSLVSMEYFMQTYAPGIAEGTLGNECKPVMMSGDGKNLVGNSSIGSGAWYLKFDNGETVINAATGLKAYFTGKDKIAVSWIPVGNLPEGVTAQQYDVYLDGVLAGSVAAAGGQEKMKYAMDIAAGDHSVYVKLLCKKGDKLIASDASEKVSVSVPATYSLPLTDDFESQSFDTNYWTKELDGDLSEIISWNISGGNVYDYENSSYFASITSISKKPFSGKLYTRFIDATGESSPYLSFYGSLTYVNEVPTNLSSDFLDIEYTFDGETWATLHSMPAKDMPPYVWSFYKVDLSQLAGKVFQLRFNVHGEGKAQLRWAMDYLTLGTALEEAPQGVKAVKNGSTVAVTWKNTFGAYEETYLSNSNVVPVYNVGNGGAPLISAVDMPAEKMAGHVGQYITSVSSFIYDDPSMESVQKTQAEAIVYEDGAEVSRQAFDANVADNPYTSTVALSTPVLIKAGKAYRIAVRIHDYDSRQSPLYYQASMEYQPGVTDLYSEDEGKTWQNIYDFNNGNEEQERAYCIWPIRANITETADAPVAPQLDNTLMAYNVYRDGKKLNTAAVYSCHKSFVDKDAPEGSKYTVEAFYTDGRVSALSKAAEITLSAISNPFARGTHSVEINAQAKQIQINGAFDRATLVSLDGQTLATSTDNVVSTARLSAGTYILVVQKDGKKATYKLSVR